MRINTCQKPVAKYDVYVTWSGNVYKPNWGMLLHTTSKDQPGMMYGITERRPPGTGFEFQLPALHKGPFAALKLLQLKVGEIPSDVQSFNDFEGIVASVPLDTPDRNQRNWVEDCLRSLRDHNYEVKPCSVKQLQDWFSKEIVKTISQQYGGE